MTKLAEKVAIVTGGSQGIGKSVAIGLANQGANIVVADILDEPGLATVSELEALGVKAMFVKLDVSNKDNAAEMVKAAVAEFGRVDILVNNAGIARDNLLMRMKPEEWGAVIAVNLTGVYNCTQAVLRTMMKQRYGRIINIASVIGQMGNAGQSNYGAAKAGVIGFTKSVAREVGSRNITVNAITPGYIDTAMTKDLPEDIKNSMLTAIPLNRMGTPEDISKSVEFLASDDAAYITGAVLNVNGGMYM